MVSTLNTRVSTLSIQERNVGNIVSRQAKIAELNRQITSGKITDQFTGLSESGNIEKTFSFESSLRTVEQYKDNNTIIANRLLTMQQSMDNLVQIAQDFRNQLVLRRSSTGATIPLIEISNSALAQISDNLNIRIEGRYLFAGSKTNEAAVDSLVTSNLDADFQPTASYYEGDAVNLQAKVSVSLQITYGVTADDPAFQKLIGAVNLAKTGHRENSDLMISNAVQMLNEAIDGLIEVKVGINNSIVSTDNATKIHEDSSIYLKSIISDITDADIPSVTVQMSLHETILQASYLTFSRISQLRLSEYLR